MTTCDLQTRIVGAVISGSAHAALEQPTILVSCPIVAATERCRTNGRRFAANIREMHLKGQLWRSKNAQMMASLPKSVTYYLLFRSYTDLVGGSEKLNDPTKTAMIGMLTGATEPIVTAPFNFVNYRMQLPDWGYRGVRDCVSRVYKTEGLTAFWSGLAPTIVRNSVHGGCMWYSIPLIESKLSDDTPAKKLVAGAAGGLVGSFFSYPFEMVRASMVQQFDLRRIQKQGMSRLFAGWAPGATYLTVSGAIVNYLLPMIGVDTSNIKASIIDA
eukprot:TRINITY_DN7462_c0_g1_i1.p1 TRINITY_DN7462_c0_g1~~TRINITY_DN7462_c0_g1_i1.p1  ORF type:complete len:293 (+),score=38.46 TRINITY_DN7462_c0_g1_i1:64-879(+)